MKPLLVEVDSPVVWTALPGDLGPIQSGMAGPWAATLMTPRRATTVDLEKSIFNDERERRCFVKVQVVS